MGTPSADLLERMRRNYRAATDVSNDADKSAHWDAFPADYENDFTEEVPWANCLRNALSVGFNDDLGAFCEGGGLGPQDDDGGLWPLRHAHDYRELLPRYLTDSTQIEKIGGVAGLVSAVCGPSFVIDNLMPDVGSPAVANLAFPIPGDTEKRSGAVNFHDLSLIYHCWQMWRASQEILPKDPLIVEIGGGYGGMIAKLKSLSPNSSVALFDLPEVNAVQTYYLASRFPDADLLLYDDLLATPARLANRDYDIAILPPAMFSSLGAQSVDLVLNIRSMMEMTCEVIESYFSDIHRVVNAGGLFYCVNRYDKAGIRVKDYPFDDRWSLQLSQPSLGQPHIHELLVERTTVPQKFPVSMALRSLPPFD